MRRYCSSLTLCQRRTKSDIYYYTKPCLPCRRLGSDREMYVMVHCQTGTEELHLSPIRGWRGQVPYNRLHVHGLMVGCGQHDTPVQQKSFRWLFNALGTLLVPLRPSTGAGLSTKSVLSAMVSAIAIISYDNILGHKNWHAVPEMSTFYGMEGAFPVLLGQKGGLSYIFPLSLKRGGLSYIFPDIFYLLLPLIKSTSPSRWFVGDIITERPLKLDSLDTKDIYIIISAKTPRSRR